MEQAIIGLLLGAAGVTAIVGQKVRPGRAAQDDQVPFIVVTRIDGIRDYAMVGPSGYVASRMQIDVYTETYAATKTCARAVVAALSGHSGGNIQGIFVDSERDLPAADAGDVRHLFRTSVDIIVHHLEN